MLTGKLVRLRHAKNRLVPIYLDATNRGWLALAEQLLRIYRRSVGRTRGELEEELSEVVGEGPASLVPAGLAKVLEDRSEFEVACSRPPEDLREAVFRHAAQARMTGAGFDRQAILVQAAQELGLAPEEVERGLFADLKAEQRLLSFQDCTAEQLLHRYNVALAQAILLRATDMEVRVWGESPARYRQLFRAVKFHRLICTIHPADGSSYVLKLDGPLSLFSSSQKYGLQLALFLPTLLHCRAFELTANVRWGSQRQAKRFTLSALDGLRSHLPDFGTYTPPEVAMFAESFTTKVRDWSLSPDPAPIPLPDGIWVPDFTLTHRATNTQVFVEMYGYWRKSGVEAVHRRLQRSLPGRFLLCVSQQMRGDEEEESPSGPGVYVYRRTPLAEEVARQAAAIAGVEPFS